MSRSNAKRRQTRPSGERWPPPGRLSLRVCKHAVVSVASELGRARDQARQRRQNGGCYKSQARDVVSGRLYSPGFASPLDLGRLRGASSNASPPWRPQRQSHRPVTQAMEMRRRSMPADGVSPARRPGPGRRRVARPRRRVPRARVAVAAARAEGLNFTCPAAGALGAGPGLLPCAAGCRDCGGRRCTEDPTVRLSETVRRGG
eukprot:COSAG03_NODE_157_length_11420_cov_28.022083_12_plen_203_part_00